MPFGKYAFLFLGIVAPALAQAAPVEVRMSFEDREGQVVRVEKTVRGREVLSLVETPAALINFNQDITMQDGSVWTYVPYIETPDDARNWYGAVVTDVDLDGDTDIRVNLRDDRGILRSYLLINDGQESELNRVLESEFLAE